VIVVVVIAMLSIVVIVRAVAVITTRMATLISVAVVRHIAAVGCVTFVVMSITTGGCHFSGFSRP